MKRVDWHYPRTKFTENVFTMLVDGPIHAVRLFGPRRMGKTEFLLRDLAELAERKGHRVVYASFCKVRNKHTRSGKTCHRSWLKRTTLARTTPWTRSIMWQA